MNTRTTKVFIPHPVLVWSRGLASSKFDLAPLERYGKLEYVLGDSSLALVPAVVTDVIAGKLEDNDFSPHEDFFLSAGDPVVLAQMCMVAVVHWGVCPRILRHNKARNEYNIVPAHDFEMTDDQTLTDEERDNGTNAN